MSNFNISGWHDRIISERMKEKVLESKAFNSGILVAITSEEEAIKQSDSHVTNALNGYHTELAKCGETVADLPEAGEISSSPYTDKLRIVSDISHLASASHMIITKVVANVYDLQIEGSASQDAGIHTLIKASTANDFNVLPVSRTELGLMPNIALSYFRPMIQIKGNNLWAGLGDTFHQTKNKGDMSVGAEYPFIWEENYLCSGKIIDDDNLKITGYSAYPINDAGTIKYVRCGVKVDIHYLYA